MDNMAQHNYVFGGNFSKLTNEPTTLKMVKYKDFQKLPYSAS